MAYRERHRRVAYRIIPGHPGYRVGDDGSVWSRKTPGCIRRGERWGIGKRWRRMEIMPCKYGRGRVKLDGVHFAVRNLVDVAFSDDETVRARFVADRPIESPKKEIQRGCHLSQDLIALLETLHPSVVAQIQDDLKSGTMGRFAVAHKHRVPITLLYLITHHE